MKKKKHGFQN